MLEKLIIACQDEDMASISCKHSKVQELVLPYLSGKDSNCKVNYQSLFEGTTIIMDECLFDYGLRYRVVVHKTDSRNEQDDLSGIVVSLHVGCSQPNKLGYDKLESLRSVFGNDAVLIHKKEPCMDNLDDVSKLQYSSLGTVHPNYDFAIEVKKDDLPSGYDGAACSLMLSNLRLIMIGQPLLELFDRMGQDTRESEPHELETTFSIPTTYSTIRYSNNTLPSICHSYIISSHIDRVIVVIPVSFFDETDRALGKLFLQQFEQAQRNSSSKNVPICEYRRSMDPPREVLTYIESENELGRNLSLPQEEISGYISFTFLQSNLKTEQQRVVAARNILMFLPSLDYHVKCTKTHIHTRLRQKKDDLLQELFRT